MDTINLKRMNYGAIIDGSASMDKGEGNGGSRTRWEACQESTEGACAKVAKMDPDGMDIVLIINDDLEKFEKQTDATAVEKIFTDREPWGNTPIHLGMRYFVDKFVAQGSDAVPMFVFVITDGVPDDQKQVIQEIQRGAQYMKRNALADHYLTFFFLQIGDDKKAAEFLQTLDKKIAPVCEGYDLVNTKTIDQMKGKKIDTIILEAING